MNTNLADFIPHFSDCRVLVVGDVMVDRFVYGEVNRISPEAPVPVIQITREVVSLGGAGNVVRNLFALGARPVLVSAIGRDANGEKVNDLIANLTGVEADLHMSAARETTVKTRYFSADGHHMLRADRETIEPLSADDEDVLLSAVRRQINRISVLILSDYAKGVVTDKVASELLRLARMVGVPAIVDPKGRNFSRYQKASVLTPNRSELSEGAGMPATNSAQIVSAARSVVDACGISAVLVTRSAQGMTLVEKHSDTPQHFPTHGREVADVTGAGDTVVATLSLALASGASLGDAVNLANAAAGVVISRLGTAVATSRDLASAVLGNGTAGAESKLVSFEGLLSMVCDWRRQGLIVGFTNGCFDILHPGHIALLAEAKQACDRLVIGLNSDDSVYRLKGIGRPVQPESARLAVISSLETVDAVIIFGEDTPLEIIQAMLPDVLVKGSDYRKEEVVGADVVENSGGRVVLIELIEQYSTTAAIEAMRKE